MALGTIPPWLNITPSSFVQAMEAGAQVGANIGAQRRQARQAADELALRRQALDINAALKEVQQQNIMDRAAQQQQYNASLLGIREAAMEQDAAQKLRDQALREMSIEQRAKTASESAEGAMERARMFADLREKGLTQQEAQNAIMNRLREHDLLLKESGQALREQTEERLGAPKLQKIVDEYGDTKYVVTGNPLDPRYKELEAMIPGQSGGLQPQGGTQPPQVSPGQIRIISIKQKG